MTIEPQRKLVTIGVYGFDEAGFFHALRQAGVDVFIDIRQRRGVRGSQYAFANRARLQVRLQELGIAYLHLKALAPPPEIRQIQKDVDHIQGIRKSERAGLSPGFARAYQEQVLDLFDPQAFFSPLPPESRTLALFCVERQPSACHRSLLAQYLSTRYGFSVEDLLPCKS